VIHTRYVVGIFLVLLMIIPSAGTLRHDSPHIEDRGGYVRVLITLNYDIDTSRIWMIKQRFLNRKITNTYHAEAIIDEYRKAVYRFLKDELAGKMDELALLIEKAGGEVIHRIYSIGAISVLIPKNKLRTIRGSPLVKEIIPCVRFRVNMDTAAYSVYADYLWNIGLDGSSSIGDTKLGIEVAVVDTGVDPDCRYLAGRIIDAKSFVSGESPNDLNGHGTMVANIIAGNHTYLRGIAYRANIINAKAMNAAGEGTMDDIIAAIEWAVTQATDTAEIINLSIGTSELDPDGNSSITRFIDKISFLYDILPVIAVGNVEGGYSGVNVPADGFNIIAVGAMDDEDTPNRADDIVYSGSCYGPTEDGRTKPEVMAPGVNVRSVSIDNSERTMTGTSFATPIVSGASALIMEYLITRLGITKHLPLAIKALIINSADPLQDPRAGFGYVNLRKASEWLNNTYILYLATKNIREFTVNLSAGEELSLCMVWWRTPISGNEFYKVGRFRVEILNSTGSQVLVAESSENNIMRIKFSADNAGTYIVRIEKLARESTPLVDVLAISSSKPLSKRALQLSASIKTEFEIYDNETKTLDLVLSNNMNRTIDELKVNITSNILEFPESPYMIENLQSGETIRIQPTYSIRDVGTGFVLVNITYYVDGDKYSVMNGTVMTIIDDDDEPPEAIGFIGYSFFGSKLTIQVRASDKSGIDSVVLFWRIEYPLDEDILDLADGNISLKYDPGKDLWIGELPIKNEWNNKKINLVVVIRDNDKDRENDQECTYLKKSIRISYIWLAYALTYGLPIMVIILAIYFITKKRRERVTKFEIRRLRKRPYRV